MQVVDKDETKSYRHYSKEWKYGFTPSAEIWNGRLAMFGIVAAILVNLLTGQGTLHFLGLL